MLARKNISNIKPYIPGMPIAELRRKLQLSSIVKLASNENAIGPSAKAVGAIKKALSEINRYPDGDCFYLKQKLAKKLRLNANNLVFGCGSDEIIILATRAFINPGDQVVIACPTFLIYQLAARIANAQIKFIPLKNFRYDLQAIKKAIGPKTKIVFIANPDNPTGTYLNKKELDGFMHGLPKSTIIFYDEAYYELVQKSDFPDTIKYLKRHNVIITRTFSKAYGLSGLRIGYGISRPEIIKYLNMVREPFNVNSLAQAAAFSALDDNTHLERTRKMLKSGKNYLYQNLRKLDLIFIESVTNFVLVKIGPCAQAICKKLLRQGIIVRNMRAWGMNDFIRVTIGTMSENKKFIMALKELMQLK